MRTKFDNFGTQLSALATFPLLQLGALTIVFLRAFCSGVLPLSVTANYTQYYRPQDALFSSPQPALRAAQVSRLIFSSTAPWETPYTDTHSRPQRQVSVAHSRHMRAAVRQPSKIVTRCFRFYTFATGHTRPQWRS